MDMLNLRATNINYITWSMLYGLCTLIDANVVNNLANFYRQFISVIMYCQNSIEN